MQRGRSANGPGHRRRERARAAGGFTLIEVLVALVLCSLLLLTGIAFSGAAARSLRRQAAHAAAERALAFAYEEVRAGLVPLATGVVPIPPILPLLGSSGFTGAIGLEVDSEPTPSLFRIHLIAVYDAAGTPSRRTLEALVYSP